MVLFIIYLSVRLILAFVNIPVTIAMTGTLVERTDNRVTMEVTGYKIRDCQLIPDGFAGYYHTGDGRGVREAGVVTFPYDRIDGNSRPVGFFNKYNFGLFSVNGVPIEAIDVFVSSEHWCMDDGVPVKVVSVSGNWDITGEPDGDLLSQYKRSFEHFNAFTLPKGE